ncbi:HAD family hydrolase [Geothrix oryzisoli]|uniref:HAD family hydrolase n=1 Tax=Geothrix oryzisoli TaxID=2922721 RepID=UPI001FABC6B9|nr:haloacid dehalogenase-like hydrolase [Geothrix oryzisoli]
MRSWAMPLCFDLDGTLGHFSSGFVLLREALGGLWGTAPTAEDLGRCTGSTDWEIVDELHRLRFGSGLDEPGYAAYQAACVERFQAVFAPGCREAVAYPGIIEALHRLAERHLVWLVSGNAPDLLAFKADALRIDPAIPRLGSLPRHDRADLLRRALEDGPGPHLYVGDRPHDLAAAQAAGLPFLGVGGAIPGDHPCLPTDAAPEQVVASVAALIRD